MAVVDKLKGGKSVLQRTKPGKDLPRLALYVGVAPAGYAVRGPDGTEHVLTQQVLTSHYKVASGKKAAALMSEHWPAHEDGTADSKSAKPKPKPSGAAAETTAKPKKVVEKTSSKKTAAKKKVAKKKPAQKTT